MIYMALVWKQWALWARHTSHSVHNHSTIKSWLSTAPDIEALKSRIENLEFELSKKNNEKMGTQGTSEDTNQLDEAVATNNSSVLEEMREINQQFWTHEILSFKFRFVLSNNFWAEFFKRSVDFENFTAKYFVLNKHGEIHFIPTYLSKVTNRYFKKRPGGLCLIIWHVWLLSYFGNKIQNLSDFIDGPK